MMCRDARQDDEFGGRRRASRRLIRYTHRNTGWLSDALGEQRYDVSLDFFGLAAGLNKDALEGRAVRSRRRTEEQQQAGKPDALRSTGGMGRRHGSHGIVRRMSSIGYSMRSSSWPVSWPASGPVAWTIRTV